MHTKIQKWGNSQGLRLAKNLLKDARLVIGDEVEVAVQDNNIVIVPVKKIRKQYTLEVLVEKIPADYQAKELDWGKPVGKETW